MSTCKELNTVQQGFHHKQSAHSHIFLSLVPLRKAVHDREAVLEVNMTAFYKHRSTLDD